MTGNRRYIRGLPSPPPQHWFRLTLTRTELEAVNAVINDLTNPGIINAVAVHIGLDYAAALIAIRNKLRSIKGINLPRPDQPTLDDPPF